MCISYHVITSIVLYVRRIVQLSSCGIAHDSLQEGAVSSWFVPPGERLDIWQIYNDIYIYIIIIFNIMCIYVYIYIQLHFIYISSIVRSGSINQQTSLWGSSSLYLLQQGRSVVLASRLFLVLQVGGVFEDLLTLVPVTKCQSARRFSNLLSYPLVICYIAIENGH